MRISDWSSDVCSSDLWRPPVAPECQPPCGAEKMCASRCVLIGRLKAFGPGSELGVARLRFKSRVPKNELAPMLCDRSEEHTSKLQSLMRISYAVFCLKKKKNLNYVIKKKLIYRIKLTTKDRTID